MVRTLLDLLGLQDETAAGEEARGGPRGECEES